MPGNVYISPELPAARYESGDKDRCQRMNGDAFPTPDYTGLNLQDYLTPEPMFSLSNARGCYWRKCAFCNVSLSFMREFRQRSMERVQEDIATVVSRYKAKWIFFADDCVPPSRCRELADYLSGKKKPVYWVTECRFEKAFSPGLLRRLYRGGCRQLSFGNESANQRVLDRMRKGTRAPWNRKLIRAAAKAGIAVHLQNFLGFPGERASEARETVALLLDKREVYRLHGAGMLPRHGRFPGPSLSFAIRSDAAQESPERRPGAGVRFLMPRRNEAGTREGDVEPRRGRAEARLSALGCFSRRGVRFARRLVHGAIPM